MYVFTVSPGTATGARTLVRRKVGWRKGIAISQRGSAGPAFLRDESRAPCQFLVRTVNTYPTMGERRRRAGFFAAAELRPGAADFASPLSPEERKPRAGVFAVAKAWVGAAGLSSPLRKRRGARCGVRCVFKQATPAMSVSGRS